MSTSNSLRLLSNFLEQLSVDSSTNSSSKSRECNPKHVSIGIDIGGTKCMFAYSLKSDLLAFEEESEHSAVKRTGKDLTDLPRLRSFVNDKVHISERYNYVDFHRLHVGEPQPPADDEADESDDEGPNSQGIYSANRSSELLDSSLLQMIIYDWFHSTPINQDSLIIDSITVSLCGMIASETSDETSPSVDPGCVSLCECPNLVGLDLSELIHNCFATSLDLSNYSSESELLFSVNIINDAKCARRLAQLAYPNCRNLAVLVLGTGIGSSFIIDGRPIEGSHGMAGFLGGCPYIVDEPDESGDENEDEDETNDGGPPMIADGVEVDVDGGTVVVGSQTRTIGKGIDKDDEPAKFAEAVMDGELLENIIANAEKKAMEEEFTNRFIIDEVCGGRALMKKFEYLHKNHYREKAAILMTYSSDDIIKVHGSNDPVFTKIIDAFPKGFPELEDSTMELESTMEESLTENEKKKQLLKKRVDLVMKSPLLQFDVKNVNEILLSGPDPIELQQMSEEEKKDDTLIEEEHPLKEAFVHVMDDASDALGFAIATSLNMCNPQRMIIAGGLVKFYGLYEISLLKARDNMFMERLFDECNFTLWNTDDDWQSPVDTDDTMAISSDTSDNLVVLGALICCLD